MDTATMLVAARTLDLVLADLGRTEQALARLAAEHRDTAMPGRTLTQHAVPTTFGLKAAGWRALVLDARDRSPAVRDSLPAQLGGAAGTLAAFGAYGASDPTGAPDGIRPRTRPRDARPALAHPADARSPIWPGASPSRRARSASSPWTSSPCRAPRSPRSRRAVAASSSAMPAQVQSRTVHADRLRRAAGTAARGHAVRVAGRRGRAAGRGLARRVGAAAGPAEAGRRGRPGCRRAGARDCGSGPTPCANTWISPTG